MSSPLWFSLQQEGDSPVVQVGVGVGAGAGGELLPQPPLGAAATMEAAAMMEMMVNCIFADVFDGNKGFCLK